MLYYILKRLCIITRNVMEHETSSLIPFRAIMKVLLPEEKQDLIIFVVLFVKKTMTDP